MFTHFKRLIWKASLMATLIGLLAFTIALAASGDLDTTFSGDGLVTGHAVPSSPGRWDGVSGIAIQTDGKIIVAGHSQVDLGDTLISDFAVLRYNTDGSLDTTFSGDGRLITDFGGDDAAHDVALQSNGKIVVSGQICAAPTTVGQCDVAMARYNPDGALDTTFSGDGKQTTDFGGDTNWSRALAIQSNGKIVLTGGMWTNDGFAVYRYLSNGSLDTTFSGDGMVNINFGRREYAYDLAIQSDGKIVVAGYVHNASYPNTDFGIARLNANGTLDTTFSENGKQTTNTGANSQARATSLALQTDGKIVVAGMKSLAPYGYNPYAVVVRYNTDGSLDVAFNGTGRKAFRFSPGADSWASDVIVQSDGKIVVLGTSGTDDFGMARLNSDGSFDTAFSGDGKVTIDFGGFDFGSALALQPLDGKFVVGGSTDDGTQDDFALARVLP